MANAMNLDLRKPQNSAVRHALQVLTEMLSKLGNTSELKGVHVSLETYPESLGYLVTVSKRREAPDDKGRRVKYSARHLPELFRTAYGLDQQPSEKERLFGDLVKEALARAKAHVKRHPAEPSWDRA